MLDVRKPIVLYAEDQAIVSFTIGEVLAEEGFSVAGPFGTCAEIANYLVHDTPDCALMDVQLSDGRGDVQIDELRRRGVPIVILSGHPEHSTTVTFKYDAWLSKPPRFEELVQTLRRHTTAISIAGLMPGGSSAQWCEPV